MLPAEFISGFCSWREGWGANAYCPSIGGGGGRLLAKKKKGSTSTVDHACNNNFFNVRRDKPKFLGRPLPPTVINSDKQCMVHR